MRDYINLRAIELVRLFALPNHKQNGPFLPVGVVAIGLAWFILVGFQEGIAQTPVSTNSPAVGAQLSGGNRMGTGGRVPTLDNLFTQLDKNHDGKISKDEATGQYAQRFSLWDADGDGVATQQEIRSYRLQLGFDDNGRQITSDGSGGTNAVLAAPANNPRVRRAVRNAGTNNTATMLKEPIDWRLETMSVPPGFAPDIKLTGTEEIRFAPGMFQTNSSTYFTCVLAIMADGERELGAVDLKGFLEKYYRGLSLGVGRRKGLNPDANQMQATVTALPSSPNAQNCFEAQVVFFDTFSDGRKITLNVEAQMIPRPTTKKTCLIVLVSPSAKETAIWQTLREIARKTTLSLP